MNLFKNDLFALCRNKKLLHVLSLICLFKNRATYKEPVGFNVLVKLAIFGNLSKSTRENGFRRNSFAQVKGALTGHYHQWRFLIPRCRYSQ